MVRDGGGVGGEGRDGARAAGAATCFSLTMVRSRCDALESHWTEPSHRTHYPSSTTGVKLATPIYTLSFVYI